jgi:hypothetical protein
LPSPKRRSTASSVRGLASFGFERVKTASITDNLRRLADRAASAT